MTLFTLSQETEEDETLPESFYEPLSPRYLNHTKTQPKKKTYRTKGSMNIHAKRATKY